MPKRFENLDWTKVKADTDGYVPSSMAPASFVIERGGEVQADVTAIDISDQATYVSFKLASDEDLDAWGPLNGKPFKWLEVGGISVNDAVMTQLPTPGNWTLVVRADDARVSASLRDLARQSTAISVAGALAENGRPVFGFWSPRADSFKG